MKKKSNKELGYKRINLNTLPAGTKFKPWDHFNILVKNDIWCQRGCLATEIDSGKQLSFDQKTILARVYDGGLMFF